MTDKVRISETNLIVKDENPVVKVARCACGYEHFAQLTASQTKAKKLPNIKCACGGIAAGALVIDIRKFNEWKPKFHDEKGADTIFAEMLIELLGESAIIEKFNPASLTDNLDRMDECQYAVINHFIINRPGISSSTYWKKAKSNDTSVAPQKIRRYPPNDRRTLEGKIAESVLLEACSRGGDITPGGQFCTHLEWLDDPIMVQIDAFSDSEPLEIFTRDSLDFRNLSDSARLNFKRILRSKLFQLAPQIAATKAETANLVVFESPINRKPLALGVSIDSESILRFSKTSPRYKQRQADKSQHSEADSDIPGEVADVLRGALQKESKSWVNLATLGHILRKEIPDFSHTSSGYRTLSNLIEDAPGIALRKEKGVAFAKLT